MKETDLILTLLKNFLYFLSRICLSRALEILLFTNITIYTMHMYLSTSFLKKCLINILTGFLFYLNPNLDKYLLLTKIDQSRPVEIQNESKCSGSNQETLKYLLTNKFCFDEHGRISHYTNHH